MSYRLCNNEELFIELSGKSMKTSMYLEQETAAILMKGAIFFLLGG